MIGLVRVGERMSLHTPRTPMSKRKSKQRIPQQRKQFPLSKGEVVKPTKKNPAVFLRV